MRQNTLKAAVSAVRTRAAATGPAVALAVAGAALAGSVGYFHAGVMPGSDMPVLGLGAAALSLCAALALRAVRGGPEREALGWRAGAAGLAFATALALSAAISAQRWTAVFGAPSSSEGVLEVAAVIGIVFGGAFAVRRLRPALGFALPVALAAQVLLVASQLLRGDHPQGSVANSTYMGQIVLLALPVVAGPLATGGARWRSVAWRWVLAAAGIVTLVVAQSFAAAFLAASWVAVVLANRAVRNRPARVRAAVAAVAGLATLSVAGVALVRVPSFVGTLGHRLDYWGAGLRAFLLSPLTGWGPDTFRAVAARVAPASMLEYGADGLLKGQAQLTVDPHNVIVWLLVAGGVIGVAAAAWCAVETALNWHRQRTGGQESNPWAAGAALYGLSLLFAPAPLQTLVPAALVLAASLRPERGSRFPRAVGAILVASGVVAGLLSVALGLTGVALDTGPTPTVAQAGRVLGIARLWGADPFVQYHASLVAGTAMPDDAAGSDLARIRDAVRLAPDDPYYALELARTLASRGDVSAPAAYERAIALFPASYEARVAYALYLAHNGDAGHGMAEARRAIALVPGIPDAYEAAAAAAVSSGDTTLAASFDAQAAAVRARRAGP